MFRGGPCPPLYIRGDRVTWKILAEYSWRPTITQSGSFLYTAASSTPIRVVTREVRFIHELSLTLEHSMPISSPATPGLTVTVWTGRLESGRPIYQSWNFGMKLYQSNLEAESRPIQWVISQNSQVGTQRLESLSTKEESWSMIREQDNYPFRSNLRPLRSVSVQWRAEKPTEPSCLAQDDVG